MTRTRIHLLTPPKLPLPLGLRPALPWEGLEVPLSVNCLNGFSLPSTWPWRVFQCPLQEMSLPGLCRSACHSVSELAPATVTQGECMFWKAYQVPQDTLSPQPSFLFQL